jgi:hypothetical protein
MKSASRLGPPLQRRPQPPPLTSCALKRIAAGFFSRRLRGSTRQRVRDSRGVQTRAPTGNDGSRQDEAQLDCWNWIKRAVADRPRVLNLDTSRAAFILRRKMA